MLYLLYTDVHMQIQGLNVQLQGREVRLHGAVVCLCGDIPAANYIGGFKEELDLHFENAEDVWHLLQISRLRLCVQKSY